MYIVLANLKFVLFDIFHFAWWGVVNNILLSKCFLLFSPTQNGLTVLDLHLPIPNFSTKLKDVQGEKKAESPVRWHMPLWLLISVRPSLLFEEYPFFEVFYIVLSNSDLFKLLRCHSQIKQNIVIHFLSILLTWDWHLFSTILFYSHEHLGTLSTVTPHSVNNPEWTYSTRQLCKHHHSLFWIAFTIVWLPSIAKSF